MPDTMLHKAGHIIVIGAGIGGLATAMRLSAQGFAVTMLERHGHIGGKMRTVPTQAGPADAGPTVLTMRWVFEDLFRACGHDLDDHVTLIPAQTLARHWWSDGTSLDLIADASKNTENIRAVFGRRDAEAFGQFSARASRLFDAFDTPMMRAAEPNLRDLTLTVTRNPRLILDLAPHQSLATALRQRFRSPHLQQLFGRYATYVGGSPYQSPSLLSLIWNSEARGVWAVDGGMHKLAQAMAHVIHASGGRIETKCDVDALHLEGQTVTGVVLKNGDVLKADAVVFNGDPKALRDGFLGASVVATVPRSAVQPRSLSAHVWAFAAIPRGVELAHHNVFFADDPRVEFSDLARGKTPRDAALYVCAQDRGTNVPTDGPERFEIIRNAPPVQDAAEEETDTCHTQTFHRLAQMGLSFDQVPPITSLTTPAEFHRLFPASDGALYGRSPHGMTAALRRPTARSRIPGLYLAGGGAHPGAGVPMAALSGQHAAETIMTDRTSTSTSHQTDMHGGMSTGSATMARAPSRSSAS